MIILAAALLGILALASAFIFLSISLPKYMEKARLRAEIDAIEQRAHHVHSTYGVQLIRT
jgi:hypothetical protein